MQTARNILIIIILSLFTLYSSGQKIPALLKNDAQELINKGDIYGAIEKLQKYSNLKPNDSKSLQQLGELFEITRNYQKAATFYYKAYESDKEKNIISLYDAARMLKMTGAYEIALKDFQNFRKNYKGSNTDRNIKKLTNSHIEGCILADSLINRPLKIDINLLDTTINKVYSEFSPFPINDSVFIYASLKTNNYIKTSNEEAIKQFYIAYKEDGIWTGGSEFDNIFNHSSEITGNGAYSSDNRRFYFTRCKRDIKNKLICSLYLSEKVEGSWNIPEKLNKEINLKKFNSTQPAIAIDQKNKNREIIYFASDREGGKGKYDIWYFTYDRRKKVFSAVKNAGSSINTPGNEITPFFSSKKMTLYFSSDGHPGLGGLDIFKATGTKRKWSIPGNIGYPLNSYYDDLYFSLIPEKNQGFIVSNRTGGIYFENYNCCDDIYSFKWLDYASLNIFGGINIQREKFDIDSIESKNIELFDFLSDENINAALNTLSLDDDYFNDNQNRIDSMRLVRDLIIVDLLIYNKGFDDIKDIMLKMLTNNHPEINSLKWKEYILERKEQLSSIPKVDIDLFEYITSDFLNSTSLQYEVLSYNDSLLLMSELYSVEKLIRDNSIVLLYESFINIKKLLPDLTEEQWNEYINQQRQKFEEEYIRDQIKRDLPSEDLTLIKPDYKKTFIYLYYIDPLTSEQILIKKDSVWPDGLFKLEAVPGNEYKLVAESPGFLRKSYDFSTKNTQWSDTLDLDIQLIPITDKPIVLENIYFDFDSYALNPDVKACLDTTLYKVLIDNPEISIEFSAHTDSKGKDSYNLKLSQSRAESVIDYINKKGIPSHRIVAKGYGESIPIEPNTKPDGSDNPDGRKKNRRVEFKIIKIEEVEI